MPPPPAFDVCYLGEELDGYLLFVCGRDRTHNERQSWVSSVGVVVDEQLESFSVGSVYTGRHVVCGGGGAVDSPGTASHSLNCHARDKHSLDLVQSASQIRRSR